MSIAKKLITVVKKHPILYDSSETDYRNTEKKDALWEKIANDFNENVIEVKKRWRNLRDTYVKLLKLVKGSEKDPVFEAAAIRKYHRWVWTKEMEFFRSYLTYGNQLNMSSISNEEATNKEDRNIPKDEATTVKTKSLRSEETNSPPLHVGQSPKMCPNAKLRKRKLHKMSLKHSEKVSTTADSSMTAMELDATDRLFLAHAQNIKQFSVRRQALTKLKIAEVIMEQEILHQEDMELSSISSSAAKRMLKTRTHAEESPPSFETVCGYTSEDDEEIMTDYYSSAKCEENGENLEALEEFIELEKM